MENIFSNQEVSEESKLGGGQQYIYGGVYHKVIISDVKKHTTNSGKDCLRITMHTEEGGPTASKDFDFFFTESAVAISKSKLKHIATKVAKEATFTNMPANSLDEYIANYGKIVKGKTLRMQFNAEEYLNSNNEVKSAARIGLPDFAEATQPGAEYPPIADEDTKLFFNKENSWQYKEVDIQPSPEVPQTSNPTDMSWLDEH